jgi:hypothetical protein
VRAPFRRNTKGQHPSGMVYRPSAVIRRNVSEAVAFLVGLGSGVWGPILLKSSLSCNRFCKMILKSRLRRWGDPPSVRSEDEVTGNWTNAVGSDFLLS